MRLPAAHLAFLFVLAFVSGGWVGVNPKPLRQQRSQLGAEQSGSYAQLSDDERKELVWMAKAAMSAYEKETVPLGYRPFTAKEWAECSAGCSDLVYTYDGFFNISSGLRGRLMVHILSEQRVVLSLSGTDGKEGGVLASLDSSAFWKDIGQCYEHYVTGEGAQADQARRLLEGVLKSKSRSRLWIVGHSLGGCLATYLALRLPEGREQVKCATFNGYGLSPVCKVSEHDQVLARKRLRNVYFDTDYVYNFSLPVLNLLPKPRHYGVSYSVKCESGDPHDMLNLLNTMINCRTKWAGM